MSTSSIDLRSDTFTVPDARMREAMSAAEVGDDDWGEDPTVRHLEEVVAERLDKAAGLFVPSGTMANLIGVLVHTRPGDEVIIDRLAHIALYEEGGAVRIGGLKLHSLEYASGAPTPTEVDAAIRSRDVEVPSPRLLCLENSHVRRGGMAVSEDAMNGAAAAARAGGLRVHCDGARLFNSATALNTSAAALVRGCDTVSVCLSKGLGAPVGSVLVGDTSAIAVARRWRKRLGGGMHQAGIIAAGGLWALDHNVGRLAEDHENARQLAEDLSDVPGLELVRVPVPTNMVMFRTSGAASDVVAAAATVGVLLAALADDVVRAVTHLNVSAAEVAEAALRLRSALGRRASAVVTPASA